MREHTAPENESCWLPTGIRDPKDGSTESPQQAFWPKQVLNNLRLCLAIESAEAVVKYDNITSRVDGSG